MTVEAAELARTETTWCRVVTKDFSVKSVRGERERRVEFGESLVLKHLPLCSIFYSVLALMCI